MQPEPNTNMMIVSLVPYVLIFGIFYFLVIRPQRQKQKEHETLLKNLQKNDEVVTASGIHGVVAFVKEKTIVVKVDDNAKIEFDREAIVGVLNSKEPQTK